MLRSVGEKLSPLLRHPRAKVRDAAIRVLGKMKCGESTAAIRTCLEHEAVSTRLVAIRALDDLEDRAGVTRLIEIARDGEAAEQHAAVEVLGHLQAGEARELLAELVEDPDARLRQAAVIALGEVGGEEAGPILQRLTASPDKKLAQAAASALFGGQKRRSPPSETTQKRLGKVRGEARPPLHISPVAALRALPEIRPYEERELTRLIAQVCGDYSTTRRHLVMGPDNLMIREKGVYELTGLGRAVWRVERFIREHYLG